MTQDLLFDAARAFFRQATGLNARYARLALVRADARYRMVTLSFHYGAREFRMEINRCRNTIRLSEVTVHRRFGFDRRNPMSGFALREVERIRQLHTHRLDWYLPAEHNAGKS